MKNSKNWLIAGLIIALAICIWFLLQPDRQHDSHKGDHRDVIAANDTLKAHDAISARIIDSLEKDNRALKVENKSLREGQAVARRKLDIKTAEVRRLAKEVQEHNKDTALNQRINDLIAQVENLTFLLTQYEQYADSINNVNDSMSINYDAMIKEKDKRYAGLKLAYDNLLKAYTDLFDTTAGLQKDLRRQKLKTKVAAVLGGVLAIISLLK